MVDVVQKSKRSLMMSSIRGKDTRPEIQVRKFLHASGFRYRLHDRSLPGKPDVVLPRYRVVILVHGCFWHRHTGCRYAATPATRPEFWLEKLEGNRARDKRVQCELRALGWRVAIVWECFLKKSSSDSLTRLSRFITSNSDFEEFS
ncbi:very short patch repair endonuclease [Stenotrophomonas maltophilia]|uniref:very short patch repair endonuclease n=1 Tax=Stenotrophomonas maltophilia group TaxID=995085 RepID=UPI0003903D0F|nr:very short patch repair endonuclease [Stenotrophomonas maltophilia]EQM82635.1 DNA glycosylase [Stenotrophomonas maltophilia MF89]MBA0328333.1 DNA mismatch endonuclease Vsr [Stenotrophomonas maltophilia]MBH1444583.1 DNA mismatch endonuclease Vsr [Stenotrophomonas maltophilia]MBN5109489.1 DNA mismatch endonuclease Vsr [Stenotrophomonas maltophilia]MCI1075831.1 very short patch repair endonuclease [Stenotrophomonas maltophilia]